MTINSNKKAALEMSVGTIVTIVLVVTTMVLGLVLIRSIFGGATNAVDEIDNAIQSEIDGLFAQEGSKIVVFPREGEIRMDQGSTGGFGFSVENRESTSGVFTYEVFVQEIASNCDINEQLAESLIILGKSGSQELLSGQKFDEAVFVKFDIPESAPLCSIRYGISVEKDGAPYASSKMDLQIT